MYHSGDSLTRFENKNSSYDDKTRLPHSADLSRLIDGNTSLRGKNIISRLYDESANKSKLLINSTSVLTPSLNPTFSRIYNDNSIINETIQPKAEEPPFVPIPPADYFKKKNKFAQLGNSMLTKSVQNLKNPGLNNDNGSMIDRIRKEDILGTGHLSDAQLQVIKDTKHKGRKLLSFGGLDEPEKKRPNLLKPQLLEEEKNKIEDFWKEQEKAEGFENTVKYVNGLVKKMEEMEKKRNEYNGIKTEKNKEEETEFKVIYLINIFKIEMGQCTKKSR